MAFLRGSIDLSYWLVRVYAIPRKRLAVDKTLEVKQEAKPQADPKQPGQIGAPIPGVVSTIHVQLGQTVSKGDRLLVMEAMKMQSTVYSPVSGKVVQVLIGPGQHVEAKELLLAIE